MADKVKANTVEIQEKSQKKTAKHDSGAADLEKVTDYVEEKEISKKGIAETITKIGDRRNKETAEKMAMERKRSQVSIKKEDVDLIIQEMEISKSLAERTLRESDGDIVEALVALTN